MISYVQINFILNSVKYENLNHKNKFQLTIRIRLTSLIINILYFTFFNEKKSLK